MIRGNFSKAVLLSATSAMAMAAYAPNVMAQDTGYEDEIVVTGIRASIAKSLDDKRTAQQIIDTINAEDIGKSTDQNIAEALNRISGVSTVAVEGEGAFIAIRGASPEQTIVTLNGAAQGTTGFSQAVDLSSFSADILAKVEVIKTPSADDEEGSLGGLVNLITRKPLDLDKNIRTVTIQGRWNSQSSDGLTDQPLGVEDHKISGTFSQKFFDDTFGIIVSAVDETNSLHQHIAEGRDWQANRSFNAEDTNGNVYQAADYSTPSLWGLAPRQYVFGSREGQRDRQALDFAAQWKPTDTTNITGNLNFARQNIDNQYNEVTLRNNDQSREPNFNNVGSPYPLANATLNGTPTPFQDPSSWMVLDADTRTWVRTLRRFETSDFNASSDKYKNENFTGSLDFEQKLFNDLTLNVGGSYQKSKQTPEERVYVNLQSARENNVALRFFVPGSQLQPHGIDCTSGTCLPVTGTNYVDLGNFITQPTAAQIADANANGILGTYGQPILVRGDDNVSLTGANPDDLLAKSFGAVFNNITEVEDTNQVLYLDADYDLDKFGISKLEFGGKYTKREKLVDQQNGRVVNANSAETVIHPVTGEAILASGALDQIPVGPFGITVAPTGFLAGLGASGNAISDGFASVDASRVFGALQNQDGLSIDLNPLGTRTAEFENMAFYGKANFDFFDERLTGDVGLRWVKTEVATTGFSGISAFNEAFGRNQRIYDLRNLRSLMDTSQPACPGVPFYPGVNAGEAARYARVDGLGWDTNGTPGFGDDTPLPVSAPCHEPFLTDVQNLQNLGFFPVDLRRYNNLFWTNNDIFSGGDLSAPGVNNTVRTFATTGAHEYDVFLPSINLNYIVNDEVIVRGAFSQSMTRPQIDNLRPGFEVAETGWGDPSTRRNRLSLFNTQLEPLKSKNFDVSAEWYFQKDALLSIGLFYKDITNLEEQEEQIVYLRDIKTEVQNGLDVVSDGLLLDDSTVTIDNCYAEILGEWQYGYNPAYVENMLFSNDPQFLCANFNASQVRNAAGADIKGVELQYAQNYTFLPGIWSGLGLSANLTYQDSSFAAETSDLIAGLELARTPIADTPKYSYNVTGFWQKGGHQLRLAYSGQTDSVVQRNFNGNGTEWRDGRKSLDFSAAYQASERLTFTFDAANLLNEPFRTYFTSRSAQLPTSATGGGTVLEAWDEGSPLDGDASQARTLTEYTTGATFRAAVRYNF